jgi:hypothetical protein
MKMVDVTMSMEEYLQLINGLSSEMPRNEMVQVQPEPKPKRRASAYSRRYKAAFKKIASKYKLKNGRWKKGGFKAAVRQAHKMAKKKK